MVGTGKTGSETATERPVVLSLVFGCGLIKLVINVFQESKVVQGGKAAS